jgi:hypothetical protein
MSNVPAIETRAIAPDADRGYEAVMGAADDVHRGVHR